MANKPYPQRQLEQESERRIADDMEGLASMVDEGQRSDEYSWELRELSAEVGGVNASSCVETETEPVEGVSVVVLDEGFSDSGVSLEASTAEGSTRLYMYDFGRGSLMTGAPCISTASSWYSSLVILISPVSSQRMDPHTSTAMRVILPCHPSVETPRARDQE